MKKPKISIIGLGKLGSPMVACFASRGYQVVGLDRNSQCVNAINAGKAPVFEPKLTELISANKERISATQDYGEAVSGTDVTFIVVPTPSEDNGGFSTKYVLEAGRSIAEALKKKVDFHLVVLTSTVVPGSTEGELLRVLEKHSCKKCGKNFGLCYNPEFIALGSVIRDMLNPDFILIGESDSRSGDILESIYKNFCENDPPIKRMNIINAELTKIALNTYVTTKISYANMLAELCEKIPGGNVDVVTDALGCDTRVGHKYLKGALGFGGPCFPRDNRALIHTAQKFDTSLPIAHATDTVNKGQIPRLVKIILSVLPQNGVVGVLGLSYKPDTDVIEESQSIELTRSLLERGVPVTVYDPAAMENAREALGDKVSFASSVKECVQKANVIIITIPWKEFKDIRPSDFASKNVRTIIIDCWRILDKDQFEHVTEYIALGLNKK